VAKNFDGKMTDNWQDSKEFWHNRHVMVTGGNGFLDNPSTGSGAGWMTPAPTAGAV
jgi:hypothetical protein